MRQPTNPRNVKEFATYILNRREVLEGQVRRAQKSIDEAKDKNQAIAKEGNILAYYQGRLEQHNKFVQFFQHRMLEPFATAVDKLVEPTKLEGDATKTAFESGAYEEADNMKLLIQTMRHRGTIGQRLAKELLTDDG